MIAKLYLEDGTLLVGQSFGGEGLQTGEVVFYTGMTGYPKVLNDPSYCGQIVTMTYPLIGNYGVSRDDIEVIRPFVHGFVVRSYEEVPSNWRAQYSLGALLKEYGIIGISGVDTRMLTRKIRSAGTMKGILATGDVSVEELKERLASAETIRDQVSRVSTPSVVNIPGEGERIVVMDFGVKSGILRALTGRRCDVIVVPPQTDAEAIRRLQPDGLLLADGPGDPKDVPSAAETIRALLGTVPIFGIGLGHQLLALACGADTEKMKFGHRGENHPVKDLASGACYMTSQNHGFTVKKESLAGTGLEISQINNNDGSIEGLKHALHPAFSVQYHPETSPEPFESGHLFDEFLHMVREFRHASPKTPRQIEFARQAQGVQQANAKKR